MRWENGDVYRLRVERKKGTSKMVALFAFARPSTPPGGRPIPTELVLDLASSDIAGLGVHQVTLIIVRCIEDALLAEAQDQKFGDGWY